MLKKKKKNGTLKKFLAYRKLSQEYCTEKIGKASVFKIYFVIYTGISTFYVRVLVIENKSTLLVTFSCVCRNKKVQYSISHYIVIMS